MRDTNQLHPIRSLLWLLRKLFVLTAVVVAAFAVVGYARGWILFQHNEQEERSTIQIETGEMKREAKHAVEQSKELIEGAASQQAPGDETRRDLGQNGANSTYLLLQNTRSRDYMQRGTSTVNERLD